MNEIEKLYKNAVEKQSYCTANDCLDMSKCEDCCFCKRMYPTFTVEKQLELIKWMIKTNYRYFIQDIIADDFSRTLAGVFNLYWQDLTREERQQIKEILEW